MKPTIVIVEDNANIALAQKMILEEQYDVHIAADGEEGLALIREKKPEVAVLDIMMPKRDGLSVCREIRQDDTLAHTKVVMVTAKNQPTDERDGLDVGADDYIMKPFEAAELLHVVNQVRNE